MRSTWVPVLSLILVGSVAQMAFRDVAAQLLLIDKNQRAADIFNKWCLEADLDLASIDRMATAAGFEVEEDRTIPIPGGEPFRQKNWLIPMGPGEAPILLTSNDVKNGELHVLGCGIYGPELDGSTMETKLSNLARLGEPTKHPQGPGGNTVWWSAHVGSRAPSLDTEVMLSRNIPQLQGVSVNLIYKIHAADASSPE
jgi:hypothetical protein